MTRIAFAAAAAAALAAGVALGDVSTFDVVPAIDAVELSFESNGIKTIFTDDPVEVSAVLAWNEPAEGDPVLTNETQIAWSVFVDDVLIRSDVLDLTSSRSLPGSIDCGVVYLSTSGEHTVSVTASVGAIELDGDVTQQAFSSGVSLVPLFVVLFLAITTRNVEVSLLSGVFVGSCIITGSLASGFRTMLDTYIVNAIADSGHVFVVLFSFFLAGVVAMIERSGGMFGLTNALSGLAKTPRSTQAVAVFCGMLIFFDDYANCLVIGTSMRHIFDAMCISREKLAFVVDATAAPIASLLPVSSWVGFEVGLIDEELQKIKDLGEPLPEGLQGTAFKIFIDSIPYRFYPWFLLFLQFSLIFLKRDFGPMLIAERKTHVYKRTDGGDGAFAGAKRLASHNGPASDTPLLAWNMLVPVFLLIFLVFYILVQSGVDATSVADPDFLDYIQAADSYVALLWGTFGTAILTLIFYAIQFKHNGSLAAPSLAGMWKNNGGKEADEGFSVPLMRPSESVESFLHGLVKLFPAIVVLNLAWAVAAVMTDVGADRLFAKAIEGNLQASSLPTFTFVLSLLLALATGTSWGTMAIVFPLVTVPAYKVSEGDADIVVATIASVLSGAVAGDHVSPISDTTVLSSLAAECDLMAHVTTQAPYVLVAAILAIVVGTVPSGGGAMGPAGSILIGLVLTVLFVFFVGRPIVEQSGKFDIFTELYLKIHSGSNLHKLKEDTSLAAENPDGVKSENPMANSQADEEEDDDEVLAKGVSES